MSNVRYVINVTRAGERVFSTSRNSIRSLSALKEVTSLLDILIEGAPEEEQLSMEVFCITPGTAKQVNGDGSEVAVIPDGALPPQTSELGPMSGEGLAGHGAMQD